MSTTCVLPVRAFEKAKRMFAKCAVVVGLALFLAPSCAAVQGLLPHEHVVVFHNSGRLIFMPIRDRRLRCPGLVRYLPASISHARWRNADLRTAPAKIVRWAGLPPGRGCFAPCGQVARQTLRPSTPLERYVKGSATPGPPLPGATWWPATRTSIGQFEAAHKAAHQRRENRRSARPRPVAATRKSRPNPLSLAALRSRAQVLSLR